jgi:hypothetical protein
MKRLSDKQVDFIIALVAAVIILLFFAYIFGIIWKHLN